MPGLDQQVAQIKSRIAAAQQKAAQAEALRSQAQAARDAALAALKEEFGVTSVKEAQDLLASLQEQAAAECKRIAELLD